MLMELTVLVTKEIGDVVMMVSMPELHKLTPVVNGQNSNVAQMDLERRNPLMMTVKRNVKMILSDVAQMVSLLKHLMMTHVV